MIMGIKFKSIQPLIPAVDVNAAAEFYQKTLGFKLAWIDGTPGSLAIVHRGDVEIFLSIDANAEHAESSSIRIAVENIDSLYAEYSEKNVIHPNGKLATKPWGLKEFVIMDLNKVCIAFHELPKPPGKKVAFPNQKLATDRLNLLPLRPEHFAAMHEIYSNPKAMVNWHTHPHKTLAETETLLNEYMSTNSSWVLESKEDHKIIGLINCFSISESKNTGMGYILSPDYQKKGLAKEASEKAIEHLFKKWNVSYIELWIYHDNHPSIALAQKLGFKLENSFERSYPGGTENKKTGIYWLKQCDWWANGNRML
jgi:RimJ/RimL family protein N-acetyltransferase